LYRHNIDLCKRIFSTGLFQVSLVDKLNNEFVLVKNASINATSWDPGGLDNTTTLLYNGIMGDKLPWPEWVSENATFEPFMPARALDTAAASSYSAKVGGFFPNLKCEEARLVNETRDVSNAYNHSGNLTLVSDSCSAQVEISLVDDTQTYERMNVWAARNFMGTTRRVVCPDETLRFLSVVTVVDQNLTLLQSRLV
jgi:hypothetical protein